MTSLLRVLKQPETQYNMMVQIDYLMGLFTAMMLGAEKWFMFWSLLVLSLILGCITVRLYVRMMRSIIKGKVI